MKRAFERDEYQRRLAKLQDRMAELKLDALLLSAPENVFYVTGYQTKAVFTFQFAIVPRAGLPFLATRQMEISNAERALRDGLLEAFAVYQDDDDPLAVSAELIRKRVPAGATIGIELGSWTMPALRAQRLAQDCGGLSWQDATAVVDRMRLVKSPAELAVLKTASAIGERMADAAVAAVAPGRTEDDITQVVFREMVASGSEYPGSWPNVMAGERTGLIHAAWEGEPIVANDHLMMEVTGVTHRYHAPSIRSVFVGEPRSEIRRAADVMIEAHAAAKAAMAPGRPMSVINDAAQAVLAGHTLSIKLARRAGYSLGIGFPPSWGAQWQIGLNSVVSDPLEIGMTFHVVLTGHFADGRAIGIGETVALLEGGAESWTRGGFIDVG
jgi:Xaa-Pro dipeptidase